MCIRCTQRYDILSDVYDHYDYVSLEESVSANDYLVPARHGYPGRSEINVVGYLLPRKSQASRTDDYASLACRIG